MNAYQSDGCGNASSDFSPAPSHSKVRAPRSGVRVRRRSSSDRGVWLSIRVRWSVGRASTRRGAAARASRPRRRSRRRRRGWGTGRRPTGRRTWPRRRGRRTRRARACAASPRVCARRLAATGTGRPSTTRPTTRTTLAARPRPTRAPPRRATGAIASSCRGLVLWGGRTCGRSTPPIGGRGRRTGTATRTTASRPRSARPSAPRGASAPGRIRTPTAVVAIPGTSGGTRVRNRKRSIRRRSGVSPRSEGNGVRGGTEVKNANTSRTNSLSDNVKLSKWRLFYTHSILLVWSFFFLF